MRRNRGSVRAGALDRRPHGRFLQTPYAGEPRSGATGATTSLAAGTTAGGTANHAIARRCVCGGSVGNSAVILESALNRPGPGRGRPGGGDSGRTAGGCAGAVGRR